MISLKSKYLSLPELFLSSSHKLKRKSTDLFENSEVGHMKRYETYWRDYESIEEDFPVAMVVDEKDQETFYADIATYYPEYSPVSAYINIYSHAPNKISSNKTLLNTFSSKPLFEKRLWVSMIIAEASSTAIANEENDITVSFSLCKRTLTYALARAEFINSGYTNEEIIDRWIQLRNISKLDFQDKASAAIFWIFENVFEKNSPRDNLTNELLKLIKKPSESKFPDYLSNIYPGTNKLEDELSSEFDKRIYVLEKIINIIQTNSHSNEHDALAIGYYCNLILPGSFAHSKFLSKYYKKYPSVIIWYGFFTGLSYRFDYKGILNGIGQKLIRDLSQINFYENAPTSDISLNELIVLNRIRIKSNLLKPILPKMLLVSLVPGVELFSRSPFESEGHESKPAFSGSTMNNDELAMRNKKVISLLLEAQKILSNDSSPTKVTNSTSPRSKSRSAKTKKQI